VPMLITFDKHGLQDIARNIRHNVAGNGLLMFFFGYTLSQLGRVWVVPSLIVAGVVLVVLVAWELSAMRQRRRKLDFTQFEMSITRPDKYAAAHAERANEKFLIVGEAVEVLPHPNLNTRTELARLGWEPSTVAVKDDQQLFDSRAILDYVGGLKQADPPNGTKLALVDTSFVTADSHELRLEVRRTDFFTLMSLKPELQNNPDMRLRFGRLKLTDNRVPHSLCLHFVVRFADGQFLLMRRHAKSAYHANRWSFSGEEQFAPSDLETAAPIDVLFKRTFCEEVVAFRDENPATLDERWQIARQFVSFYRLLSVFVEERLFNFELLGYYQLSVSTREFVDRQSELVKAAIGMRDNEGDLFTVSEDELLKLFFNDECQAVCLFSADTAIVTAGNLHPTSRYRMFRTMRAIKRGPLTLAMAPSTSASRLSANVQ